MVWCLLMRLLEFKRPSAAAFRKPPASWTPGTGVQLRRAVTYWHRHAFEQAWRRWRGGRCDDSARTRRKILISTQARPAGAAAPSDGPGDYVSEAPFARPSRGRRARLDLQGGAVAGARPEPGALRAPRQGLCAVQGARRRASVAVCGINQ